MQTSLSSRAFNQDIGKAKRAAEKGPVVITMRDKPAYVLLTIQDYEKLTHQEKPICDLLAMPGNTDLDWEPPILDTQLFRPAEFD